ncbi:hypothetical protein BO79DRAFT_233185 [Aspergillus costaricaensis CBS 115574]|uniref:Uncharacterized protein n=1 Tax=Aspergillus costaricaensis CBS 115574 TaxID=1448317 RepID=A0ACD1I0G9_9EURO|nr:hypothetical protein BO79DRAFT_233185 [Aspergillus costaricaensis CBS 115574]RAK83552.1 hypothetical protein BO79DRAFT_233185 [Aspergillus costaricaensis CBS 115574]
MVWDDFLLTGLPQEPKHAWIWRGKRQGGSGLGGVGWTERLSSACRRKEKKPQRRSEIVIVGNGRGAFFLFFHHFSLPSFGLALPCQSVATTPDHTLTRSLAPKPGAALPPLLPCESSFTTR